MYYNNVWLPFVSWSYVVHSLHYNFALLHESKEVDNAKLGLIRDLTVVVVAPPI